MPITSYAARHALLPHPSSSRGAVRELAVSVSRTPEALLSLRYELHGGSSSLRVPERSAPVRTDELWRHTCFEAFVGRAGGGEYREYNFSPSGAWAAYQFSAYREGMAPLLSGLPPTVRRIDGDDLLVIEAVVDLAGLRHHPAAPALRLGLSAVVEDAAGVLSYWALAHPSGKPDFHHVGGFVIELE